MVILRVCRYRFSGNIRGLVCIGSEVILGVGRYSLCGNIGRT